MAYQGGYGGGRGASQRPYAGPAAPRPNARGGYGDENTQRRSGGRQPYDDYNDGYGYESQPGAYDDGGSQHHRDQYGPGPGPGRGGGPMQPYARGGGARGGGGGGGRGHPARPIPADGPRGAPYPPRGRHPGPGRGPPPRGGPPNVRGGGRSEQYPPPPVDHGGRRPPPNQHDAPYGGYDQDQQLAGQMSGMDLSAQPPRGVDAFGRPVHGGGGRGQHAGYGAPPQGRPAGSAGGGNFASYDGGYGGGQSPTRNDRGPSGRSMTMPANDPGAAYDVPAGRRVGPAPFDAAGDMGSAPPRPATAGGHRPPPRRMYPPSKQGVSRGVSQGVSRGVSRGYYDGGDHCGGGYANPSGPPEPVPGPGYAAPGVEFSDSYHGDSQVGSSDQRQGNYPEHSGRHTFSDFDSASADHGRRSYDQTFRGAPGQPQPGAHGTPKLHHARSEANFHEPQAAVFEMAGDIPSVPRVPPLKPYRPEFDQGHGEAHTHAGYDQLPPRGPSAPPGAAVHDARRGFDASAGMSRHNTNPAPVPARAPSMTASADPFPLHPTPVRPGLMPNSVVNMNDRPPPVRNYSGVMQQPQAQTQHHGQARPPQPQQQEQYQQEQYQQEQYQPEQYRQEQFQPEQFQPEQYQQEPYQQEQYQQQQQQQQQQPPGGGSLYPPAREAEAPDEPVTAQQLERLRMAIKVNVNDQDSALKLAKKLIQAADQVAPKLPDPKQRNKTRERYLMDAHKVLKKLAGSQQQEAMYILADGLGTGLFGHEPDTKEAFTLYQSAAKLGHAQAAYRTAVCCEIGQEEGGGTRKDPLKAMQWYRRAAMLGDPAAMYKVGMILLKGLLGQPRNPREAVQWLRRAADKADRENPHALHELGLLYESAQANDSIIRDEGYAFDLFHQAAVLGYKFSEYRLGLAFECGHLGVGKDDRQSICWYSLAAQQEEHQSELALCGWYLTGSPDVLNQSDTEAYLWARRAAVSGLARAEYAMGYLTEMGIGVAPNMEDAKRWYWRAAAQDLPGARNRLEDLKRVGRGGPPRARERITRGHVERLQEGDCTMM